ncbi:flagellar protein FlaG [Brevibacillus panacihumi]|uniref:Flagellar protein FlaG n=1 Tax=Brevibacillus panacihumi TaxID=497735 RepID=A0A3M8DB52_9BACL|nr:flagellar protein FlaG [Brevibacillus panacihumi]RNB85226.1 flagellar protein FlaG [Brevibacillus panacihumi]
MSIQGSNAAGYVKVPYVDQFQGTGNKLTAQSGDPQVAGYQQENSITRADLEREVESLNKFMQSSSTHLKFTLHEKLNEYYVQIINDHDGTVVREIPSKKIMDMVAKMHEMIGLLVDEKR